MSALQTTDPIHSVFGFPNPPNQIPNAFHSPTLTETQRTSLWHAWICAYYQHPTFTPGSEQHGARDLSALIPDTPAIAHRNASNSVTTPNGKIINPLRACLDVGASARTDNRVYNPAWLPVLKAHTIRALFPGDGTDAGEAPKSWLLPRVQITHLYMQSSVWMVVWAAWEMEKIMSEMTAKSRKGREVQIKGVEDANHFVEWFLFSISSRHALT